MKYGENMVNWRVMARAFASWPRNILRYQNLLKFLAWAAVSEDARAKELSEPEDPDYYGLSPELGTSWLRRRFLCRSRKKCKGARRCKNAKEG